MASTIKKNTAVDAADYNNFIRQFCVYYPKYRGAIEAILNVISETVMVKDKWTTKTAQNYSVWFKDEAGSSDGCDKLNAAIKAMDELFERTCYAPIKEAVQLIGEEDVERSYPMIKKAASSASIYDLLGVKKYRKANFPTKNMKIKRENGWKAVINKDAVNTMVKTIEDNIKVLDDYTGKIQKLVRQSLLVSGQKCIDIKGFNGANLQSTINLISTRLNAFKTKSNKITNDALNSENVTADALQSHLEEAADTDGATMGMSDNPQ